MGVIIYKNNKELRDFLSKLGYHISNYTKKDDNTNQYIYCYKTSYDIYDERSDDYYPIESLCVDIHKITDDIKRLYKDDIQCGIDEELFKIEAKKEAERD